MPKSSKRAAGARRVVANRGRSDRFQRALTVRQDHYDATGEVVDVATAHRVVAEPGTADVDAMRRGVLDQLAGYPVKIAKLEAAQAAAVARARSAGVTWTAIAKSLGVTPQAVQKRYGGAV